MKKTVGFLCVLIILFSNLSLLGCAEKSDAFNAYYFKTLIHIETHGSVMNGALKDDLNRLFAELDEQFNHLDGGFTSTFNSADSQREFNLTDMQTDVFELSLESFNFSAGLFNPAVYPLIELYQFAPNYPVSNFTPPSNEDIQTTLLTVQNFSELDFNKQNKTVKNNLSAKLDFGGIVKGYAAQKAGEALRLAGHKKGYVSVGGSSLYVLESNNLLIRHPENVSQNIVDVNLKGNKNLSVSTSGDYEKYYLHDGIKYSHLINPTTGLPTDTGVKSVTVIGGVGGFLDAVTTACCLIAHYPNDLDNSPLVAFLKKIISTNKGEQIYAVYNDGTTKQILTNKKKGEDFTLLDNDFVVISLI